MFNLIEGGLVPIKAWTQGVPVEPAARQQLINAASLPFIHDHIAVMPDVHFGRGATLGGCIAAGETDAQIRAFLVARYGDFILMNPPLRTDTFLLWFGPILLLLLGGVAVAVVVLRSRRRARQNRDINKT